MSQNNQQLVRQVLASNSFETLRGLLYEPISVLTTRKIVDIAKKSNYDPMILGYMWDHRVGKDPRVHGILQEFWASRMKDKEFYGKETRSFGFHAFYPYPTSVSGPSLRGQYETLGFGTSWSSTRATKTNWGYDEHGPYMRSQEVARPPLWTAYDLTTAATDNLFKSGVLQVKLHAENHSSSKSLGDIEVRGGLVGWVNGIEAAYDKGFKRILSVMKDNDPSR